MDPRTFETQMPPIASVLHLPFIPRQLSPSGFRKDCIRLRGLPYEVKVIQILEFLGGHVNNIVFQGVHLIYTVEGKTSGDAFIQMDSEQSAYFAAKQRNFQYMIFGRKMRYIEVYQCSVNDMNLALMGVIRVQKQLPYTEETLFPQHYATYPYPRQTSQVLPTAAVNATSPIHSRIPRPLNYPHPFNLIYLPYPSQSIPPTTYCTHSGPTMYTNGFIQMQQNAEGNHFVGQSVTLPSELALQVKNFQDIHNPYMLYLSPSYIDTHYQSD